MLPFLLLFLVVLLLRFCYQIQSTLPVTGMSFVKQEECSLLFYYPFTLLALYCLGWESAIQLPDKYMKL